MKVVFRVDATVTQGTGHLMRCITIARELKLRNHEVKMLGYLHDIPWLQEYLEQQGFDLTPTEKGIIDIMKVLDLKPDLVVVDSYEISSRDVSSLGEIVPVLAIVDNDHRDIYASIYLDSNLRTPLLNSPLPNGSALCLFGPSYSLVRPELLNLKRNCLTTPESISAARLAVFFGGSDPDSFSTTFCQMLPKTASFALDIQAPINQHEELSDLLAMTKIKYRIHNPSPNLQSFLRTADLAIVAAGTSSWELATTGIPTVFIQTAENQLPTIEAIEEMSLGLTFRAKEFEPMSVQLILDLLTDQVKRKKYFVNCQAIFDGMGAKRVVESIEKLLDQ